METKKKRVPNTIVIIIAIIFCACILTWIVPAGTYTRYENAAGVKVINPAEFTYNERTPVNPLKIPNYIVKGFKDSTSLFLLVIFSGGVFQFVNASGALQSAVAKLVKKFSDKSWIFITLLSLIFCVICTVKGVNTFIPFAPIFVMIAKTMGMDSIVGVAIILLGGAVGFSTGTLNSSTTLVAQELSELPLYSGLGYRTVCMIVFFVATDIYLVRYAMKVKKDPRSSYMYDLDQASGEIYDEKTLETFGPMTTQKWMVLAVLTATIAILVSGSILWGWGMDEMSAGYLWAAAAMAFVMKMSPSAAVTEFFKGIKTMVFAASILCVARAMALILNAGGIIDTIIHALAGLLNVVPVMLQGPAMYVINIIVNVFVTSGSGQAAVIIPIVAPLADMIGMTRQTAILAFNFGDGFCNYILPTSSALMGILSTGNVPYDRWMKFMWKLFLIWLAVGSVLMIGAQILHLGPM